LVGWGEVPGPGQIRDTNRLSVARIAELAGAEVTMGPILRDDAESTRRGIALGLGYDALVLSGGVSMGAYDLVGQCLRDEGAEVVFHKVAIKPGKPLLVARAGGCIVFGLPGNPVSAAVTARVFLAPTLRRLAGGQGATVRLLATLDGPIGRTGDRANLVPVRLAARDGRLMATPISTRGSADVVHHSRLCALALHPAGAPALEVGAEVQILLDPESLID
jgi:molybdopterin molybdotransferase